MNCRHVAPLLHFPLLALIDYRGFRLLAISYLPVNSKTLMYGSANGGATVHADIPELTEQMEFVGHVYKIDSVGQKKSNFLPFFFIAFPEESPVILSSWILSSLYLFWNSACKIGKALNLEKHHVGDKEIALCGDIEAHQGTDSRFYCLDFARVFPPQISTTKYVQLMNHLIPEALFNICSIFNSCREIKSLNDTFTLPPPITNEKLYKLLRPELVQMFDQPLNSDSCSLFQNKGNLESRVIPTRIHCGKHESFGGCFVTLESICRPKPLISVTDTTPFHSFRIRPHLHIICFILIV